MSLNFTDIIYLGKAVPGSGGGGGAVSSVNGQTGDVVLNASDVGAIPQYAEMPVATADDEDAIVQYTGTTDANYTNGYFYKCVSDGGNPATYSWTRVDVQPTPSGLPDQTGHSGEFLTTDGTDASWATVDALPTQTGHNGEVLTTNGTAASWTTPTTITFRTWGANE